MANLSVSSLQFRLWPLLSAALFGCAPGIGDECQTSADCSQNNERLCDVTQRGGYCTIFNCEPNTCPDESVCIVFGAALSTAAGCQEDSGLSRVQRSFCMASCGSDDDCRSGYVCTDLGRSDNPWSAIVAGRGSGRVCMEPLTGSPIPSDRPSEVCIPPGVEASGTDADAMSDGAAGSGD